MRTQQWQRDAMDRAARIEESRARLQAYLDASRTEPLKVGDRVRWTDSLGFDAAGTIVELGDQAAMVQLTWREEGTIPQGRDMRLTRQGVAYGKLHRDEESR